MKKRNVVQMPAAPAKPVATEAAPAPYVPGPPVRVILTPRDVTELVLTWLRAKLDPPVLPEGQSLLYTYNTTKDKVIELQPVPVQPAPAPKPTAL